MFEAVRSRSVRVYYNAPFDILFVSFDDNDRVRANRDTGSPETNDYAFDDSARGGTAMLRGIPSPAFAKV